MSDVSPSRPDGAALDATADTLARRALAVLPADRPRGRADVARLPGPIAHLLEARLDAALDAVAPASPFLDAHAPAARAAAAAWRETARPAAQFPAGAWDEAVREAAHAALRHLVSPAATLAEAAVAGDDGAAPIDQAIARMRAFGPYPYFPEIVARYAERKALETFDRDGLERLLERIHRRMVAQFGPDEWRMLLEPLFELAAPVGHPAGTVPAAFLRPLLATDGPGPADALGDAPVRLDDLHQRLTPSDAPDVPFRFDPEPRPSSAPAAPEAGPAFATRPPDLHPPPLPPVAEGVRPPVIGAKYRLPEEAFDDDSEVLGPPRPAPHRPDPVADEAAPDDDEPLWRRLARERGGAPVPDAPAEDDAEPLWRQFADADEPADDEEAGDDAFVAEPVAAGASAPDDFVADEAAAVPGAEAAAVLEARVLGDAAHDQRDWFVAHLFSGDLDAYRRTLARLDDAQTYTEATTVISDDVFRAHRVSPYTDASVAFTDAVQAQYGGR